MSQTTPHDIQTACARLMTMFESALALEEKRRLGPDGAIRVPLVSYMLAQMRMRVCPALSPNWLECDPVHIALLGGTNSGKSTVVNLCLGRAAAGMHVTARFSQYPEAYRPASLGEQWLEAYPSRFAGYARYRDAHPPRQSDHDLATYGYRPMLAILDPACLPATPLTLPATPRAVFWDAPDFSTEAAQTYLSAVLDVVALADVVIMTVTDESYADDRGTALLRLVSDAGVQLHVVANKIANNDELLADMKGRIDENWRGQGPRLPAEQWHVLPLVPGDTPEQRLSNLLVGPEAVALREAMAREAARGTALKRQTLAGAVDFLERHLEAVLRLLLAEVDVASAWEHTVTRTVRTECLERYRSEYLHGQHYGEFNRTLVQVLELLEVPWIGPIVKRLSDVVRLPFRLARRLLMSLTGASTGTAKRLPEQEVLVALFERCQAALKSEAQVLVHTTTHPAWAEVVRGLDSHAWYTQMLGRFELAYAVYRQDVEAEVQRRAAAIYGAIAQRPWLLNVLRGTNLAVDAAAVVLVVKSGGLDWSDAVVGPIVAGLRHTLLEAGLETYLTRQQELLRQRQFEAMEKLVAAHLVQPVCDLFVQEVRMPEIEILRQDFAAVKAAALRIVRQEGVCRTPS